MNISAKKKLLITNLQTDNHNYKNHLVALTLKICDNNFGETFLNFCRLCRAN